MTDLLEHVEAGGEVDLEDLIDAVSALISRDVQDVTMLLQIGEVLSINVPDDLKNQKREIKNRIIQFLNGNVIATLPGIVDVMVKLQEDINLFLFPEDDGEGSVEADEDRDKLGLNGLGRGFVTSPLTGRQSPPRRSSMPTLHRHHSTSVDDLRKKRQSSLGGVPPIVGGFGGASYGGVPLNVGAPGGVGGFRRSEPVYRGRGFDMGLGSGVGRGDGGARRSLGDDHARRSFETRTRMNTAAPAPVGTPMRRRSSTLNQPTVQPTGPVVPIAAHRLREFKIHGKIGEPPVDGVELTGKDKDNLSYSNVMLQIQDGVAAGYADREIVGAVLRATSDPSLRDFLVEQVIGGLSVDGLKEVLGTHFSVETAAGLYKKMVGRKQRENESIQKYVQEMMKMRDQVLRLSAQEESHYTRDLMQDVFQKRVSNGLLSAEARQALRSTLKQKNVNDFDLRQEISELMLDTADQSAGEERPSKKASVKQVTFTKKDTDQVVASVVKKLDDFELGMNSKLTDFKKDILEQCLQSPQPPTPAAPSDGFMAYRYPQLPFWSGGGQHGSNYGYGDGGRGGYQNRGGRGRGYGGRGGYGAGRGFGYYGNRQFPLRKPLTLCDICTASNAVFCNHCYICGNVDHVKAGCPEKDNPAFKKSKN